MDIAGVEFTLKLSLKEVVALQKYLGVSSKDSRREVGLDATQSEFIETLFGKLCGTTDSIKIAMGVDAK